MLKKLKLGLVALLLPALALAQTYPSPTFNNVTVQGTLAVTGAPTFTAPVPISSGGTGQTTASAAAHALGLGAADSPTFTGLTLSTTPLSVASGGTGGATQAQYQPLAGSGTGAITTLGTGTAGQVLTSNGNAAYPSFQNVSALAGRLIGIQTFCPSGCTATGGTYTPTSGTNSVIVEVQAAGGGSGGAAATSSSQLSASPGGGAGAYAKVRFTSGFSGATITIGAAGAAGTAGGAGGNASATSFGSLISCPGGIGSGAGGVIANTSSGGITLGAAATAAPTISGGTVLTAKYGGGTTVSFALGGQPFGSSGSDSTLGVGGRLQGSSAQAANAGSGYGSGPSGAANIASQSASVGQAGQPGIVIVYEYN